ncbi:exopolyphosphatase, partial [Dickeya dadantii]|nr:exopolyphosphatase [Dickeya dadantii]
LQNTNLPGFNQEQQLVLSMIVRLHRKAIKLEELPRLNLFKKKQYLPLVQLLRLATLLNNQRQATTTPESLQLHTDDNYWTLTFSHDFFTNNTLVQLDLEREQEYWQDVTGWKLVIEEEKA